MDKKVLLTGVTGLIGKEIIKPLLDMEYEIFALTIDDVNPDNGVNWIKCNLFDDISVIDHIEILSVFLRQSGPSLLFH